MIMFEWLASTTASIDPLTLFILGVAAKGSLIFAAAGVVVLALGRRTAATRHLVWALAAGAAVGVPVLSVSLPVLELTLPTRSAPPMATARQEARTVAPLASAGDTTAASAVVARVSSAVGRPEPRIRVAASTHPRSARSARAGSLGRWVPWAWGVGAALSLLPSTAGLLSLWRLGRSSRPLVAGPAARLLERLAGELGLSRAVRLVESEKRAVPMTWGLWRPVVLLPQGSQSWSEECVEMVLSHELAHVKRGDFLTGLLGRLACALYWFNPLAWLAAMRIRVEQERACDDLALGRGLDPSDYARHLLEVLSRSAARGPVHAVAPAMASTGPIEQRLRSILDPSRARARRPLTQRQAVLAALVAACVVMPLAAARPRLAHAAAPPADENAARSPGDVQADLLEQLRRNYVKPPDEAALRAGALGGMMNALHDPYSVYIAPAELAELETQIRGSLTGIGARLVTRDGRVVVDAPLPDSPAQKAGIAPGDVILEVDGAPAAGLDARGVARRIAGAAGTLVRLKVAHEDGREVVLEITRTAITVPTVRGLPDGAGGQRPGMVDPEHKVGYAQVIQLASVTPVALADAIRALQAEGMKGLILDLRSCPGGTLEAAVGVASLFLPDGIIVTIQRRDGAEVATHADAGKALGDFPLVVLINEQTASAAEIVAGALQDRGRAVLVGTRTVGKGSVQSLIRLKEGSGAIKLTTAYYKLPGGRNIDHVAGNPSWGVDPNEGDFVPMDAAGAAADSQLAAALKAMTARLTTGEFAKVGRSNEALADHLRRREAIQRRRAALVENLEKLDRELSELSRAEPR
jgi:carboxyl-terminal processing protease